MSAGARWNASGSESGTGKRHGPGELSTALAMCHAAGMAPTVNPDILIDNRKLTYIQPVPRGRGCECCVGLTTICCF